MTKSIKKSACEVRTFEGERVICIASQPASKPGVTQIAFATAVLGNRTAVLGNRLVVEIPSGKRIDLAMALLGVDGSQVKVTLSNPKPKKAPVIKPGVYDPKNDPAGARRADAFLAGKAKKKGAK